MLAKSASDLEVFFDQLDLLVVYVLDEGRQASEGLFATTSHSHQQGGRSRLSYYADYLEEILEGVVEEHQFKFLVF